jgi:hypothetical protein
MKAIGSFNIYKAKMRITAFAEPYITCGWRKRTEIQGEQVIDYVTLFFSFVVRKILVGTGNFLNTGAVTSIMMRTMGHTQSKLQ